MRTIYKLFAISLLIVSGVLSQAAQVKISDLPLMTSPSTNTFIEVADMDAVTKSGKYLLTNLATVTGTNGLMPGAFTVATLPAGSLGKIVWCSDAITPEGVGCLVIYDGTNWINTLHGKSTGTVYADVPSYLFECLRAPYAGSTPITQARFSDVLSVSYLGIDAVGGNVSFSGAGAGSSTIASTDAFQLTTGSTSTGRSTVVGAGWTPVSGDNVLLAAAFKVATASTDAESFASYYGTDSSLTTMGNDGNWFVYDRSNVLGFAITLTNNWVAVSKKSSAVEKVETAVVIDPNVYHQFAIHINGSSTATFYIDGVPVATNSTEVPTAAQYVPKLAIEKSLGATARTLGVDWSYRHMRWNTARSYWP